MRQTLKTGAAALALVLAAACGGGGNTTSGGGSGASGTLKGKTLHFSAVLSLTGAGSVYGPSSKNGVLLAQDVVNKAGGVNGGVIAFDVKDDASDKQQAAQATQTAIQQDQALAILGPTLSNSAVAAHPLADQLKTPMMGVSTTGIGIVGNCPYPCSYVFRDSLGEADAIPANIKAYADKNHPKTAALVFPNDDKFSADGAAIVKQAAPQNGITLTDSIEFTKAEADLSPYVTRALAKNPDVLFITSLGDIPARIMSQARKQGFKGQFLGGNGFNTAAVSKQAGDAGKGAQSGSAWYIGNTFPGNADFVKAFRDKYGSDPDQFAAQGYTAVLILADSAKRAGLTLSDIAGDRVKLKAAMEKVNLDSTPLGPFQFTSQHDVKQTIWVISMNGTGGFDLVTSIKPT